MRFWITNITTILARGCGLVIWQCSFHASLKHYSSLPRTLSWCFAVLHQLYSNRSVSAATFQTLVHGHIGSFFLDWIAAIACCLAFQHATVVPECGGTIDWFCLAPSTWNSVYVEGRITLLLTWTSTEPFARSTRCWLASGATCRFTLEPQFQCFSS